MTFRRLYYAIKPFVPWSVRIAVRRWFAVRKRRRSAEVWPILPGTEKPPPGWPGWPDGKQFAFVLTHDVEGRAGVDKCRQVMELEMRLGFRSSFNFIPEGEYRVPRELREELTRNGFEVGVHDFHHDGRLFSSRAGFCQQAPGINRYLKDWGAVGFRAGFMLNELAWLHDLNILYDASTFDTDPFEPQPEGRHTIFPFFVPAPAATQTTDHGPLTSGRAPLNPQPSTLNPPRSGYVELPYTLPQDSTLFLLFRERTIDIWRQKLDWIAQHGGMALVNVHPDYLCFSGQQAVPRTFPAALYEQFLEYVRQRYGGDYWQPLPRDLANFAAGFNPPSRKRRRVCMITHSYYSLDVRVKRYAEALAERGDQVDVAALRQNNSIPSEETLAGVKVFHLQTREGRKERSKLSYLLPLLRFLCVSSWWLTRRHWRNRYDLVHVHNVPDFLVFAAWYPRLTGARIILDIHDIVPEFFASKFQVSSDSPMVRVLKWIERRAAAFSHHVILSNHLWLEKYTARAAPPDRCSVLINYVDTRVFRPRPRTRRDDRLIVIFPGGLQYHQGVDIAIRALAKASASLPQLELHIYGDGHMATELKNLARDIGLADKVRFFEFVPLPEIAAQMAEADLGVVPKRANSFGNEAYSTKILQFMALGVPVVVSDTKIDRYYFDDSVVRFFQSGNEDALGEAMLEVLRNKELREGMIARASEYAGRHSWDARKHSYLQLVDLLAPTRTDGLPTAQ